MVGRFLRGRKVETIGTTAKKRFGIPYDMPCPALEAGVHAQPIIWYFAVPYGCPFSFACAGAARRHMPLRGQMLDKLQTGSYEAVQGRDRIGKKGSGEDKMGQQRGRTKGRCHRGRDEQREGAAAEQQKKGGSR